jgi:hypothetical protein
MPNVHKVLWIDDGVQDMGVFAAPVLSSGRYIMARALNPPAALEWIRSEKFSAVVVDIRLPCGDSDEWGELFARHGRDEREAKLGLELLRSLLHDEKAIIQIDDVPEWISPGIFGVLTVEGESEIVTQLPSGVVHTREKSLNINPTVLLELMNEILGVEQ